MCAYVLALHSELEFQQPKLEVGAGGRKSTQTSPRESICAYVLALHSELEFQQPKLEVGARKSTQTGPRESICAYVLALHSELPCAAMARWGTPEGSPSGTHESCALCIGWKRMAEAELMNPVPCA